MARREPSPIRHGLVIVAVAALGFALGEPAWAQDAGAGGLGGVPDYPIPATVREAYSPIGEGFESPIEPRENLKGPLPHIDARQPLLTALSERLQDEGPFLRDTRVKLNSRTYWMSEDIFGLIEPEALTTGGSLSYVSGFFADFLQLRGVLYTSQPLYASQDAGATLNLTPDGDQITTFGQANARLKFAGQEVTIGRQLVRTPYLNPNDFRMIPLTFEGIVLLPEERKERKFDYIAAYLLRYKPRHLGEFVPFTEAFGVRQDEGMLIAGARYRTPQWNYGLINYWIADTMNTAYGEIDYTLPFGGNGRPGFRLSVNNADQRSVGEELIPGSPFHTFQASARLIASYRNFVLTGAVSRVGDDAAFVHPFGVSPVFTGMMLSSFQRAGERGIHASLSYDFAALGFAGLKFLVGFGRGVDAIDAQTGANLPDRDEIDLRLEYEPHGGPLEGLRVEIDYIDQRLIGAALPSDDFTQFRAVVNYAIPLL